MKLYFALLPIFITTPMFAMEVQNPGIQHIVQLAQPFNTMELCTQPCKCLSRLGSIDNFDDTPAPVQLDPTKVYTFDMEGFDKLSLQSLECIFETGINHHAGNKKLWHFHKQFLIPLVQVIKDKQTKQQAFFRDTTIKLFSIVLRDLLIAQDDNTELLSILFKAGANPDYLVNTPEVTGDLSTKPVFFFAKTVALLKSCIKNHAKLPRVDSQENTILHEIVCDSSLSLKQKEDLLTFCLKRGVNDDLNSSGQTACDICRKTATQYRDRDDIQNKWNRLVDMLLQTNPARPKKELVSSDTENSDDDSHTSSLMPASEPIPIPTPERKRTSWWVW